MPKVRLSWTTCKIVTKKKTSVGRKLLFSSYTIETFEAYTSIADTLT